eukprot:1738606-Amphidinium_carterae.1
MVDLLHVQLAQMPETVLLRWGQSSKAAAFVLTRKQVLTQVTHCQHMLKMCFLSRLTRLRMLLSHSKPGSSRAWGLSQGPEGERLVSCL